MVQKRFLTLLSLLLGSTLFFSSCDKDDETPKVKEELALGAISGSDCRHDTSPYSSFRTSPQKESKQERVVFEALDGGILKISHLNWSGSCGGAGKSSEFKMTIKDNKITLREFVEDRHETNCICNYDNSVEIKGLSEGNYVLQFISSQNGHVYFTKSFDYTKGLKEVVYATRD